MENYNNSTGNCQNSGEAGHMVICPIDWLSNVKEAGLICQEPVRKRYEHSAAQY